MRQNMSNVNLPPVVMDRGNDPHLVPPDIENGEFSHLVRMGKYRSNRLNVWKNPAPDLLEPLGQPRTARRMPRREVVQPLAGDYMHPGKSIPQRAAWKS